MWSEEQEKQGQGRGSAGQHRQPTETVSFEPLLVDSEVEPEIGGIQETGQMHSNSLVMCVDSMDLCMVLSWDWL